LHSVFLVGWVSVSLAVEGAVTRIVTMVVALVAVQRHGTAFEEYYDLSRVYEMISGLNAYVIVAKDTGASGKVN
jgi:hypothetical protein